MRLLLFSMNYAPEPIGIGKYSSEWATWLAQRGHAVDVVTALPHYPAWSVHESYRGRGFVRETLHGVQLFRVPLLIPQARAGSLRSRIVLESSFNIAALRWMGPILAGRRYDAVLSVSPPLQTALWPWLYASLRRVPWIFHLQDLQIDAALRLGILPKSPLIEKVLLGFERFFLRRATRVSTISGRMRDQLSDKGVPANDVWFLPNWADVDAIRPSSRLNALRVDLGIPERDIVVLYAGSMGEKQGLDIVLDAAATLAHDSRLRFILVGQGPARHRLEGRAAQLRLTNVHFYDLFSWEDVPSLLALGDVHLVVQKCEAADLVMPSKLGNILAAGRASIATADPETELYRVLMENDAGVAILPGSSERLAQEIARLADDERLRSSYGSNARTYAERYLSKGRILEGFEHQLSELLERTR